MRLLELFSGTNSVGKEFPGEVISLDILGTPTHKVDILEWDYTIYPPGHFHMIWASPECTQYSSARVKANTPRDLIGADKLVHRAIQIIGYFKPPAWFIENPWGGMLRRRSVVSMLPMPKKVSYCKYGARYQKHTAILTNTDIEFKCCKKDCNAVVVGESGRMRHEGTALRGASKHGTRGYSLSKLHSIPPLLCRHICQHVSINKQHGENRSSVRTIEFPGASAVEASLEES